MAIKQAIKRGTVLTCIDVPTVEGQNYMVVDFADSGYLMLVSMDSLAEHAGNIQNLDICDFWKISNKYLNAHFEVEQS